MRLNNMNGNTRTGSTKAQDQTHGPLMMKAAPRPSLGTSARKTRARNQNNQHRDDDELYDSLMDPPSQRVVWEQNEGDDSQLLVAPTATTKSRRNKKQG